MKLTVFGAGRCVTGSKYLLEWKNYTAMIDCGLFQGPAEQPPAELGSSPLPAQEHRRCRPDPRPHRPLRLAAAAGSPGLQRPRLLHAADPCSAPRSASRCRPHPGGGGPLRQQEGLLEARARPAALPRGGRPGRTQAARAGAFRRVARAPPRHPFPLPPAGPHPRRRRHRARDQGLGRRPQDGVFFGRRRPLRRPDPARTGALSRAPTSCSSSPPTAIDFTPMGTRVRRSPRRSRPGSNAAASF